MVNREESRVRAELQVLLVIKPCTPLPTPSAGLGACAVSDIASGRREQLDQQLLQPGMFPLFTEPGGSCCKPLPSCRLPCPCQAVTSLYLQGNRLQPLLLLLMLFTFMSSG